MAGDDWVHKESYSAEIHVSQESLDLINRDERGPTVPFRLWKAAVFGEPMLPWDQPMET